MLAHLKRFSVKVPNPWGEWVAPQVWDFFKIKPFFPTPSIKLIYKSQSYATNLQLGLIILYNKQKPSIPTSFLLPQVILQKKILFDQSCMHSFPWSTTSPISHNLRNYKEKNVSFPVNHNPLVLSSMYIRCHNYSNR